MEVGICSQWYQVGNKQTGLVYQYSTDLRPDLSVKGLDPQDAGSCCIHDGPRG